MKEKYYQFLRCGRIVAEFRKDIFDNVGAELIIPSYDTWRVIER